jgi:hypothetical protein
MCGYLAQLQIAMSPAYFLQSMVTMATMILLLQKYVSADYYNSFTYDLKDSFLYADFTGFSSGTFQLSGIDGKVDFWIVDSDGFETWKDTSTPPTTKVYSGTYCNDCKNFYVDFVFTSSTKQYYLVTAALFSSTSASGTLTVNMKGNGKFSEPTEESDTTCFVENSLIQLKNGTSIPIQFAQVGDEILSLTYGGELVYSPVIAFPHPLDNDLRAKVITVDTEENSVTLSRDHLLPVCFEDDCFACGTGSSFLSPLSLVPSQDIKPNMCLRTAAASDSAWAKVTSVSSHSAPAKGMYTVVTLAAYPVVDGIVASPFGTSHVLPSLYYSLHATCYRLGLLGVPAVKMGLDLMNQQMTDLLSQRSVREVLLSFSSS